jgi:hypothetical protein
LDDAGDNSLVDELPVALLGDELEQRSHQAVLDLRKHVVLPDHQRELMKHTHDTHGVG